MLPVFLPYFALFNAAFSRIATTLLSPASFTFHNIYFTFFELSSTQLALKNTLILGSLAATLGTLLALVIATSRRARRSPAIACSRFSPPRRSRSPASCSAWGCS